jgi:hypothetical protein
MGDRRDELVEIRKEHFERLERMRRLGDYAAGAADIRGNAETLLRLLDHLIERTR